MKILVLGSQGMLGRDLVSRLPGFTLTTVPPITVIGANHAQVDITQGLDTSRFIAQERPDVIVNFAAFTGSRRGGGWRHFLPGPRRVPAAHAFAPLSIVPILNAAGGCRTP